MNISRLMVAALALAFGAHSAMAQGDMYSAAKKAAQNAANATNAHVETEQHPEAPGAQKSAPPKAVPANAAPAPATAPATKPATTPASTPGSTPAATPAPTAAPASAKTAAKPQPGRPAPQLTVAKADTISVPPIIYREAYEYESDGRRDPFVSLLTTNELRPALSDLRLSNIIWDPSGRRSIAVMRDMTTNTQYRVTTGTTLGRMRVSAIHVLAVVFTIEEFGTSRMDSLVLRDSTKRGR
ncbi:MAG TPA: hypothetical protein VH277_02530 [Gemmatimonadaceae bacterium]|jgi:hypothetical protein|nr:hypothetical protein [Gemmatimonadaceae bacterium]